MHLTFNCFVNKCFNYVFITIYTQSMNLLPKSIIYYSVTETKWFYHWQSLILIAREIYVK